MKILITGNLGYVGSVVVKKLRAMYPESYLMGLDLGFYSTALTTTEPSPDLFLNQQIYADVRSLDSQLLDGIDSVVHLAAISNDPMGNKFEDVTLDINHSASFNLIRLCAAKGVKNFVFASSCSMYGSAGKAAKTEKDSTNPITAYAKSKILTEESAKQCNLGDMNFTSLRFATACGFSQRLRLDLVLNDFVACSITSKNITVLSDGSPWRPLIDVNDMAKAICWGVIRERKDGGQFLAVNTGNNKSNYQVKNIAEAVAKHIPNTNINLNENATPDKRSYKVNFDLFEKLAPQFQPSVSLSESIQTLIKGLRNINFNDCDFRESQYIRLNCLNKLIKSGYLNKKLEWTSL